MLQSNNNGSDLPDITGLADDLGMDTDMKPSINPLNNPSPAGKNLFYYFFCLKFKIIFGRWKFVK